jgi:hypothetical protein
LRHCTTSWVFSLNARSAGIEITPASVITSPFELSRTRKGTPAETL